MIGNYLTGLNMSISRKKLTNYLNELLKPWQMKDYCPNGLQVEGKEQIETMVTGVTASQALVDAAIEAKADAIFVHHGYFWKSEDECITGMKKRRLKALLDHNINLYAYHLPLDVQPTYGNNVQLAQRLNIHVQRSLEPWNKQCVALKGKLETPMSLQQFSDLVCHQLDRKPFVNAGGEHPIETIACCTGGGQHYIDSAANQGIDAFLSGEASEQTVHVSNEMGIHFIAAGHHATERYGAQSIGQHLAEKYEIEVEFIDIDNPI